MREIEEVRETGFAYDREEHASGICTVAIAAQDPFGSIFALSVPVPTQRFALLKDEIEQALQEISSELKSEFEPN
jgi:DNA-binding IclR family transcriptional regulator